MASSQGPVSSTGAKLGVKTSKAMPRVPTKSYTEMLFEFSDGKGYDISSIQAAENNTKITLDPDYQMRWEITLGASIKQQCGSITDRTHYIARIPKGFTLIFDPKKGERHVVGHPGGMGRDFWYHNVGEFAPHALWLAAPAPYDRSKCSCEPCKKMLGKPKAKESKKPAQKRKQPAASTSTPNTTASRPSAPTTTAPTTTPAAATAATAAAPATTAAAATAAPPAAPAAVALKIAANAEKPVAPAPAKPPAKPAAKPAVARPPTPPPPVEDHSIYRAGEVVWYGTQTGIWRIGLILSRARETTETDTWVVAPLGHKILNQESSVKPAAQMRPFHAFSLPGIDIQELQESAFAEVDWPAFVHRYAGSNAHKQQLVGLEASKMAARDVNVSFSTFNRLGAITPDGRRGSYGGIFLGPEMIRVGDAVRVTRLIGEQDGSPDIMEIKHIVDDEDCLQPKFHGDVWRSQIVPLEAPEQSSQPQGVDLVRQIQITNEVLRHQGGRLDWFLVETDAERVEADVRGRFYVTFDLLPDVKASLMEGNPFDDGTQRVNARLRPDKPFYIGRKENRRATFGDSASLDMLDLGPNVVEG
ncbi:hypothetical protein MGG_01753 [Pyricularia oryzae 70-15]|uniref:Cryptic loci regulator 2 C-terminal domain-containing protein n=4 Tax=Pyricularia oryzae TaxID=318829 RepID=G4MVC1_PYRO7|nr:uncharacterized protein MGG_01753 [Pyricularia oryzae 70-15]ELQ41169.1 hypothetical protein OOU_Y34scaffold00295g8 [Pyricularia oryzae Y34]KAI7918906.1 hypothetical protein M0657_007380 [Pyricularia oryzae]EHA54943.1 hypothetical protein MGG_01753 [Pyricularia oryzae 70-15]KAI7920986.1 hypothetical protein M9X92_005596 [Pyricularia oryzae]QBZ56591.1 hypothetical protein PoMZ_01501 [Pyricularia oryzae]